MKTSFFVTLNLLAMLSVQASPRTSASYSLPADVMDSGGHRAGSASYSNVGSAGSVAGISTAASPAEVVKTGYIAQLYDVTGFAITAHAPGMNETGSLQLEPVHVLDDSTHLAIPPAAVVWNVESGPITVTLDGVALADVVYQDTPATARGTLGTLTDLFEMTVYNGAPDNYLEYASDSVDDDWQVLHFGLPPNVDAGPLGDPDGDGQNNRFEFIAGLVPADGSSLFKLRIANSFQGANLIFGPIVSGRTYTVKTGFDFLNAPNWPTLAGGTTSDAGNERTVTDPGAPGSPKKFYRVQIEK